MFKTGEHFVRDFDEGFKISGSLSWIVIGRKNEVFSLLLKIFPKTGTNEFQTLY